MLTGNNISFSSSIFKFTIISLLLSLIRLSWNEKLLSILKFPIICFNRKLIYFRFDYQKKNRRQKWRNPNIKTNLKINTMKKRTILLFLISPNKNRWRSIWCHLSAIWFKDPNFFPSFFQDDVLFSCITFLLNQVSPIIMILPWTCHLNANNKLFALD